MFTAVHIADIHWRGLTRHEEYTNSFLNLEEKLKKIKPDIIFVGGDIFHTKTQNITPEVIEKISWMFKKLSSIAYTHVILGNHDGNLANEDRQDVISPIINMMGEPKPTLYKKSGVYPLFKNEIRVGFSPMDGHEEYEVKTRVANLCVFSCFDKDNWKNVKPLDNNLPNIAAFHGSIAGCKVDTDWVMESGEEEISFFDGYDFAWLGDIHKRQFLALRPDKNEEDKPYIAYPGSMIQQNFGEDESKGFLVWKIKDKEDWDVEYVELENKYPFITIPWAGTVEQTIANLKTDRNEILKGSRFRIETTQSVPQVEFRQIFNQLKTTYGAEEVTLKDDSITNLTTINTNNINLSKTSLRNDIESLMKLYKEYIAANAKHQITDDKLGKIKDVITSFIDKINVQETDQARDVLWSIKQIEFGNTFRYGDNNIINFQKLNGVVGVFGPNKTGKSSIPGTIMYNLFNTTDRGPVKTAQIINRNKKSCYAKTLINVAGTDYLISRESKKAEPKRATTVIDEDKASINLSIHKIQNDGTKIDVIKENDISRTDTDKIIRKLIGTSQDFLLTAFSNQGGINNFIDQGATNRKTILNKFLDLEIFEKMYKYANEEVAALNAKTARFANNSWDELISGTENSIEVKKDKLKEIELELETKRNIIDSLRLWIMQHENVTAKADMGLLKNVKETLTNNETNYKNGVALYQRGLSEISKIESSINLNSEKLSLIAIDELRIKNEKLSQVAERLRELNSTYREQNTLLQTQEKSVRKLALVPCGDKFPECHFIKDSHHDKTLIESQRNLVKEVFEQISFVESELKSLQSERLAEKIKEYEQLTKSIDNLTNELKHQKLKLETIENANKQINDKITSLKEKEKELLGKINLLESNEIEQKKKELEREQQNFSALERRKNDILIQMGVDKNSLDRLQKDRIECAELISELKIYESVASAFSKNGVPAMILKSQLPAINMELSKILSSVVDFKISLETDISSNVMDVYIEDAHSKRIIELASGMEKMVASLALRVALINLSSLPKSDMFIIDEGFGVLDDDNMPKVLQLLVSLKSYFKTILIISHVPQIKEIADKILEIKSNELESTILLP